MNPMQWLKALYETFGVPYPQASLIIAIILGALISGVLGCLRRSNMRRITLMGHRYHLLQPYPNQIRLRQTPARHNQANPQRRRIPLEIQPRTKSNHLASITQNNPSRKAKKKCQMNQELAKPCRIRLEGYRPVEI
jgi:hypothetical protein